MIKLVVLLGFSFFNPPTDSLRQEVVNGKIFVIHQVDEKETLYALSRRYGATVDEIIQYNPQAASGLEIGQLLRIPYVKPATVAVPAGSIVHKVEEKETLYSLSRLYNVSVEEIKQWNKLTGETLAVGQEIVIRKRNTNASQPASAPPASSATLEIKSRTGVHVVATKETLYSIARQYGISIDDLKKWNNLQSNELSVGQSLFVAQPEYTSKPAETTTAQPVQSQPATTPPASAPTTASTTQTPPREAAPAQQNPAPITITESVKGSDEISESGLAELIEGTEGNRKYLALHRTAPIGTILKIRNEMNNREVFVRVMGKLPDTALTSNLIIKISKSAYDRLGAIDQKFRVQITYYK